MSTRSTAEVPRRCCCGQVAGHPVHRVPPPRTWWQRILSLAWPRFTWGHTSDVHKFIDRAELGATRAQVRRMRREIERARRRAGGLQ